MSVILDQVDPTAEIACTLPVNEMAGRLQSLQDLIATRHPSIARDGDVLRIRMKRIGDGDDDLEAEVTAWAKAERACCAFLGFAIDADPASVTLAITTPADAGPTLDGIEWLARAAGRDAA